MLSATILSLLGTSEEALTNHLNADVREIFAAMTGGEVIPIDETGTVTHYQDTITAMVGFAGAYNGIISITTSHQLALKFTSRMLGIGVDNCESEIPDALGEIANMIGGSFKHHFVKTGYEVRLSLPSVITGDDCQLAVGSVPDTLTLMFTDEELFTISLYMGNNP